MTKEPEDNSPDYEVGYKKPPKEHQFKKGVTHPNRRKKDKAERPDIDIGSLLNEPIKVKTPDGSRDMLAFEVATRKLANQAIQKRDLNACKLFFKLCARYGISFSPPELRTGGVVNAPAGVEFGAWFDEVTTVDPETGKKLIDDDVVRELLR